MKQVHIECKPDELLVSKLGFKKKQITHHAGKTRIFSAMVKMKNQLAIVDEDPGSAKSSYQKSLRFIKNTDGISMFSDQSGNTILVLKGKLEDWIIDICKKDKIKLSKFGLPDKPDELHKVINYKLSDFNKLLDELIKNKNTGIGHLKSLLVN